MLSKLWNTLNKWSSKKPLKYSLYISAVAVFFALILIPPILGILIKIPTVQNIINQPALMNVALTAIRNSFIIGLIVAALDLLAGIPLAWLITRSKSRWLSVLDTFADIPFIVPTAALGYSLLLFWSYAWRTNIDSFRRTNNFYGLASGYASAFYFFLPSGRARHSWGNA